MIEPTADQILELAERIQREAHEDDCTLDLARRSGLPRWTHHEYDLARAILRLHQRTNAT